MARGNAYGGRYCSPDERPITTIGTGYIANFMSGGYAAREGATLTNKRIYFSGKVYARDSRGRLFSSKRQNIVNVRDVTGTGYEEFNPLYLLLFGAMAFVLGIVLQIYSPISQADVAWAFILGVVVCVTLVVGYFLTRKTFFTIEYAGGINGMIMFNLRWIQPHEADNFIRDIHLVKDKLYSLAAYSCESGQGFLDDEINNETDERTLESLEEEQNFEIDEAEHDFFADEDEIIFSSLEQEDEEVGEFFCYHCGEDVKDGALSCDKCGGNLSE